VFMILIVVSLYLFSFDYAHFLKRYSHIDVGVLWCGSV